MIVFKYLLWLSLFQSQSPGHPLSKMELSSFGNSEKEFAINGDDADDDSILTVTALISSSLGGMWRAPFW
jgi:hypothetical protein